MLVRDSPMVTTLAYQLWLDHAIPYHLLPIYFASLRVNFSLIAGCSEATPLLAFTNFKPI